MFTTRANIVSKARTTNRITFGRAIAHAFHASVVKRGPGLQSTVDATFPRVHVLSKPPLQPVPCEQVRCREATGVWLKLIT